MIHSKHICFILLFIGFALLGSCTTEDRFVQEEENRVLPDGTPFDATFGGFADGMVIRTLRATGNEPDQITDLRLLVFDENRRFLYSRKAVLGAIVNDNKPDADHLPDGEKNDIEQMMHFTANLVSSSRTRYIHFIANHDWNGFPQDYFIEGVTDGELIGGMLTQKTEFWRMVTFNGLQQATINGKVIKLLRNNAKVSVTMDDEVTNFTYSGFTVYNAPDKATVAPFIFDEEDFSYQFPTTPQTPTIPAGVTHLAPEEIAPYPDGYNLFEVLNASSPTPAFIIMKGQLQGKREGYYKIDLVKVDIGDDQNPGTGVTYFYNVVRNYHYRVTVSHVANEGYATAAEAARNPAGNNLFASVELADFPSVSDGKNTLDVEKLGGTFVSAPAEFTTQVLYTGGIQNVKYFPSWDTNDAYLGDYVFTPGEDVNEGTLTIPVKQVPTDRTLEYSVNVVAKSASSEIITRKITLYLRSPYDFHESIVSGGSTTGSKVTISFDVPATMNKSSVPFDVLIETKELTPDTAFDDAMILVLKNGKYYYRYTVKDDTSIGKRIDLHFTRNRNNQSDQIHLTSDYYNPVTLTLSSN